MYCKSCGMQIDDNSRFCNYCGAQQGENDMEAGGPERAQESPEQHGGGRGKITMWLGTAVLFLAVIMGMAVIMPSLFGILARKIGG